MRRNCVQRGMSLWEWLGVALMLLILAAILFPIFAKAREGSSPSCGNNQRQIVTALMMYTQDHDDKLPPATNVWPAIALDEGVYVCPQARKRHFWQHDGGYGFNQYLGGRDIGAIRDPAHLLATADSKVIKGLLHTADDIALRHDHRYIASFIDGHTDILRDTSTVKWK